MFTATQTIDRGYLDCACGKVLGECLSPGCPIWLGDPYGRHPWAEGWSMSEYSGSSAHDTRMGRLVNAAKYGQTPYADRLKAADEIAERMMSFITDLGDSSFQFDACITAPSHSPRALDVAKHLCERVSLGFGVLDLSPLLSERVPVQPMKSISTPEARLRQLEQSLMLNAADMRYSPRAVLIVDDVFESGATATVIARNLAAAWPQVRIEVLTATHTSGRRVMSQ